MSRFSVLYEKLMKIDSSLHFMDNTFTDINILLKSDKVVHAMEFLCFFMQSYFCKSLENLDKETTFKVDRWLKPENSGGGVTCVLQHGNVIEKGGVNLSVITGELTAAAAAQMRSRGHHIKDAGSKFSAVGISSVIHPRNPHSPNIHFNFRYFEVDTQGGSTNPLSWFGGGCDLNPCYVYKEDAIHFHQTFKNTCDKHDLSFYEKFKKEADEYFYIPHRGEHRGIGGLFFDDLIHKDPLQTLSFIFDCALSVIPAYIPILARTTTLPYSEKEKEWQLIRRGRYVEFNVMYDRGTKFGLSTPGSRIESILMSLPLHASWSYCYAPESGSLEEDSLQYLIKPFNWIEA